MKTLEQFINENKGKPNVGTTPGNTGECVGLIMKFAMENGCPQFWGNAKDLYANAPIEYFEKIPNSPNAYPVSGDILIYDYTWGGGFGHTGIIVSSDPKSDSYTIFEQNLPFGATPRIETRNNWSGVIGWIRIKNYKEDNCEEEKQTLEDTIQDLRKQRTERDLRISDLEKTINTERKDHDKETKRLNDQITYLNGVIEAKDKEQKNTASKEEILMLLKILIFGR